MSEQEIHAQTHEDISIRLGSVEKITSDIRADLARLEGKIYSASAIAGLIMGFISFAAQFFHK